VSAMTAPVSVPPAPPRPNAFSAVEELAPWATRRHIERARIGKTRTVALEVRQNS
jgi:hypothetical protein